MATFASAVLLAAALLTAGGRFTHAASTAEVLWRAAVVPDAVLRLLRPDHSHFADHHGSEAGVVPAAGGSLAREDDSPYSYDYTPPSRQGQLVTGGAGGSSSLAREDDFGYDGYKNKLAATPKTTTAVFFRETAVRVGERLALHFRAAVPAPTTTTAAPMGLLPRADAEAIPFTAEALPSVLQLLGVAPGSPTAAAMADTLRTCEEQPAGDQTEDVRFCATSLEALVERAVAALGGDSLGVRAITSTVPRAGLPPQTYVVRAVRRVVSGAGGVAGGDSFVACHDEPYPYTVYRCHGTGPARAYLVEMEGALAGGVITVATVCHTDTSRWNPDHVSFKVLGTKPGGEPVCHLMPYGHIIWAKNVDTSSSSA